MTRFPREGKPEDPNEGVIAAVREALRAHGLKLHLASDASVEDILFANIAAYMWACQYGIALFEDRVGEGLNYNLVIEVGAMIMAGRQTALLRDMPTVEEMPTDLVGHIYKDVDFSDISTVGASVGSRRLRSRPLRCVPRLIRYTTATSRRRVPLPREVKAPR
jgi:hypothetical protein